MLSYAAGDLEGFELLYRRHSQSIYRFFYFGTHGDKSLSAELYEDVWLTVVRGRARYTNEITFTDWLYHSAWARLHDHLRIHPLSDHIAGDHALADNSVQSCVVSISDFRKREQAETNSVLSQTIDSQKTVVESAADEESAGVTLLGSISQLSPEHKEVVLLRFCFSMNNQEISDFLDVNKSVVDKTVKEAVKVLRSDVDTAKEDLSDG